MIVESSASLARSQLASHLVTFMLTDDDVALDIIEMIALRMPARPDAQVAALGRFVRANLMYLEQGAASYCEVLERFTAAALLAGIDDTAFAVAISSRIGY